MSYSYTCDWNAAFAKDLSTKPQVGYLTDFNGIGLAAPLKKDLNVGCPFNSGTKPPPVYTGLSLNSVGAVAVAVLASVQWGGGVGDPFSFSGYMSQENAGQLTALPVPLTNTTIMDLGWWITNFDRTAKVWFEENYPQTPVNPNGQVSSGLQIAAQPVEAAPGVLVYHVSFQVAPKHTATINVASSSSSKAAKSWGA
jgi:hypothetical protein